MTIASEITRIKTNIENTYAKAEEKGATMPEVLNSDALAECIESIPKSSGGGGGEDLIENIPEGKYRIRFLDYDGTILSEQLLNKGDNIVYPENPTHERLTFNKWTSSDTNVSYHSDICALYKLEEESIVLKVNINEKNGMTFNMSAYQRALKVDSVGFTLNSYNALGNAYYKDIELNVDFGDGTVINKSLAGTLSIDNINEELQQEIVNKKLSIRDFIYFSHTYEKSGTYYITITPDTDYVYTGYTGTHFQIYLGESSGSKLYKGNYDASTLIDSEFSDFKYVSPCYQVEEIYLNKNFIEAVPSRVLNFNCDCECMIGYTPNLKVCHGFKENNERYITPLDSCYYMSSTNQADKFSIMLEDENYWLYYSPCIAYSNIQFIGGGHSTWIDFDFFKNIKRFSWTFHDCDYSGMGLYNYPLQELLFSNEKNFGGQCQIALYGCDNLKHIYSLNNNEVEFSNQYSNFGRCPVLEYDYDGILFNTKSITIGANMNSMSVPKNIDTINNSSYNGKYKDGYGKYELDISNSSITNLNNNTFCKDYVIGNIKVPSTVTSINKNGLERLQYISSIDLSNVETSSSLDLYFNQNKSLKDIKLNPLQLYKLYDNSFYYCEKIKNLDFLNGISITLSGSTIASMFSYCKLLAKADLTFLDELAQGVSDIKTLFSNCENIEEIILPNKVFNISSSNNSGSIFQNCKKLKNIVNLSSLKKLGYSAFSYCQSIEELDLSGIDELSSSVFSNCNSLKKIWIPSSLTKIGASGYSSSPFYNVIGDNLVIYTDATEKPSGWGNYWNYTNSSTQAPVYWGATKENYENGDLPPES